MQGQVQFVVAPLGYVSHYTKTVSIHEGGSPMDQRYLKHYEEFFDDV